MLQAMQDVRFRRQCYAQGNMGTIKNEIITQFVLKAPAI